MILGSTAKKVLVFINLCNKICEIHERCPGGKFDLDHEIKVTVTYEKYEVTRSVK